jgi:hypothetical protein
MGGEKSPDPTAFLCTVSQQSALRSSVLRKAADQAALSHPALAFPSKGCIPLLSFLMKQQYKKP